jgi:hypothetical protein
MAKPLADHCNTQLKMAQTCGAETFMPAFLGLGNLFAFTQP